MNYKNAYEEMKKLYELLQEENKQLRDSIRQMDNSVDKLQKQLIKEKDNWNKLKSWTDYMHVNTLQQNNYGRILDKIQELEGSDSDDSNR